ncbi:MAG: hypothetical protein U1G07_02795 [Verrucomicrobiota bacterium]
MTSTNTVAYRPVQLGPVVDGKRVVRSGLEAGEMVVNGAAGSTYLFPGSGGRQKQTARM